MLDFIPNSLYYYNLPRMTTVNARMEFVFPQNAEMWSRIREISELTELVKQQNALLGSNIAYRCVVRKSIYLYAKCKYQKCPSYLTYRYNESIFQLVKFNNTHNHSYNQARRHQYSKIEEELDDLPITVSTAAAKHHICSKYRITPRCFYYLSQKIRNKKTTFNELANFLDQRQYQVQTDPYYYGMNELPDLLIAVSPLMKENFRRFGQWMGFDFTFNLIQEVKQGRQPWRVGVFVGISAARKIVPFGLVICNQETADRYYSIFKTFGEIMNKFPEIIISDEDKATISALKTLQTQREFNGHHLLDCFHILRNVKKRLINKECFQFFNRLIRQRSKETYERIVMQAYDAMENESDVNLLKKFLQHAHYYSFCNTPNELFGFMPNTAMNEKTHDLIKTIIPYSKPFTVVVKKILLYLEQLGLKCYDYEIEQNKMENTFSYPPLKEIRFSVCKSIFKEIVTEFSKSIHLTLNAVSPVLAIISQEQKQYQIEKIEQRWKCNCNYLQKTGILCSHLIKLLLFKKERLTDYIHPRWKIQMEQGSQVKKKYTYQRKTRRNRK